MSDRIDDIDGNDGRDCSTDRVTGLLTNLLSLKTAFLISTTIFILGCVIGFIVTLIYPDFGEEMITLFTDMVAGQMFMDVPEFLAIELFLNNLLACTVLFLGGITLGLLTVFVLFFNGLIIGGIIPPISAKSGIETVILGIVPHGIFEIPALLFSGALGILVGHALLVEIMGSGDCAGEAKRLSLLFVKYIIPFLLVAACIEAFITPLVISVLT